MALPMPLPQGLTIVAVSKLNLPLLKRLAINNFELHLFVFLNLGRAAVVSSNLSYIYFSIFAFLYSKHSPIFVSLIVKFITA